MKNPTQSPVLTLLGLCPVCKKGQIVDNGHSMQCNHFVSMDDKCSFSIYPTYFNYSLNSEDIKELITKGETKIINDFVSKAENKFSAKLKVMDGKIQADFSDESFSKNCPCCAKMVKKRRYSLMCEDFSDSGNGCNFNIPLEVCGYSLSQKDLTLIFEGKQTDIIDDFSKSDGSQFSSRLQLNKDKGILEFNNEIGSCPSCKSGKIFMGSKAFNCSNYKSEVKCKFTVWKEIRGKSIGIKELSALLKKGNLTIKDFKSKTGNYSGVLSFDKDFVIQFTKEDS